ncbi:hypothetical protein [Psychrobacillus sp. FSL K6-1464]|uniref:hypothetical protein n=1 Tax=Psychrobacillus sp. FSL K6-1464 TaxID=2921545 RepID=UPI0030F5B913
MNLYCEKDRETGEYQHFYSNKIAVSMCGAKKSDIVEVLVIESTEEDCTHWAYKDLSIEEDEEEEKYQFLYQMKKIVEMCSPDGFKSNIQAGEGAIVPVVIKEVSS